MSAELKITSNSFHTIQILKEIAERLGCDCMIVNYNPMERNWNTTPEKIYTLIKSTHNNIYIDHMDAFYTEMQNMIDKKLAINLIKVIRSHTGMDLMETKNIVDIVTNYIP
jgi:ribosomal protein L7/L12